jgi:hypothetical protein
MAHRFNLPKWLKPEYPKTEPFTHLHDRFMTCVLIALVVWMVVSTILVVAAVGYEYEPQYVTDFNATTKLWYENIFPQNPFIPITKTCQGSIIKVQECISLGSSN